MIDVAFNIQHKHGYIKIEETSISEIGVWESTLPINVATKKFHTESDVTYAVIDVPLQAKREKGSQYQFLFQILEKYNVSIPMNIGTPIVFSGKLLTHIQVRIFMTMRMMIYSLILVHMETQNSTTI